MNILDWPNYRILSVDEHEHDYQITAEQVAVSLCCPHCASLSLYRHEVKPQLFLDIPIRGKRTALLIIRKRYRCRSCNKTFYEPLEAMNEHHMMTKRLVLYIAQQSLRRTFASVADDTGIDERTVRRIFQEANQHTTERSIAHSSCIGIDEVHLLHKPRCVISDITERKIIELLRDRNKATVTNYLYRLPQKSEITLVCMDMWRPYFDAVRLVLPQAQVIVDHFHVVKLANECLETVRKTLRAELSDAARRGLMHDRYILLHRYNDLDESKRLILEAWTESFPKLKSAYWLKESFFNIWQVSTRAEAESCYQQWQSSIPAELEEAFQPLLTAVTNWHEPIFAYFDHRVTNAYTEALNGLIKTAQRNSRGFSFEVLRTRVLQTGGLHRIARPPIRERKPATPDVLTHETTSIPLLDSKQVSRS